MAKFEFSKNIESGQALLLVVLVMVIALTLGLAVATRSIVNVRQTTEEEQSQRAFSAAEAGVERALRSGEGLSSSVDLGNNSRIVDVQVTPITSSATNQLVMNNGNPILVDDGVDLWLTQYPNYSGAPWTGTLTLYWGRNATECFNSAMEVIIVEGTSPANATIRRVPYDDCTSRRSTNGFSDPLSGAQVPIVSQPTLTLYSRAAISITNGLLVRIVPLYFNDTLVAQGSVNLPPQGDIITARGQSGNTQRKISVYRGYPKVPTEIFQNVLFSP